MFVIGNIDIFSLYIYSMFYDLPASQSPLETVSHTPEAGL